jgi:hypothetical protein
VREINDIVFVKEFDCSGYIVEFDGVFYLVRLEYSIDGETVYAYFLDEELI